MRKDVNVWAGKTVSSVADGYEAFVLAQIANAKKPVLYICLLYTSPSPRDI